MIFLSMVISLNLLIISIMILLSIFFMNNKNLMETSGTPFECGFEPLFVTRVPFSIQYFLILIIFLIFDLEIIIFIPLITNFVMNLFFSILIFSILMMILMLGLIMEWLEGSLEWYF
uniref:NADH-ubiquinone oxidoreductase chain 3 n=1 Tax=Laemobothrion tinnunculi TaxID=1941263 RepID=A0A7T1M860_9NEOP|nr:NADH dehydrogenase subunit 3 [Laemobothrion tinnunculi]